MALHLALPMPPAKRDRPPGRKQARSHEGGEEYMEVWSSFLQMKIEEHKQREARWNRNNLVEERKVQIEEKRLLWEQEQKIMFCDVSKLDDSQRTYVLAIVMNSTCIHLRVRGLNIYMYKRGEYTKNPLKKYNNRKDQYISNTPLSNSWWINNTEFEEVKLMMSTSLSLREEICQLEL
jgi:hypothetical protein